MAKMALVAFNGEMMCFVHVLLNALDGREKGHEVTVVVEGTATRLIPQLAAEDHSMHGLYRQVRDQGLFAGVCRACSHKMGVLSEVEKTGLNLLDDMKGHPSLSRYVEQGYQVLTF